MDWQPTPTDPNSIFYDAGSVVIGAGDVDGSANVLQVTGSTSLDAGAITTDGSGNIQLTGISGVTINDTADSVQLVLGPNFGDPGLVMDGNTADGPGRVPAQLLADAGQGINARVGITDGGTNGTFRIQTQAGNIALLGVHAGGSTKVNFTGLPSNAGTPPAGLSAGDLWIDTTAGSHQGILKVY